MPNCKTCAHLRVPPNAAGRIVVHRANVYPCTVPIPRPPLPACVTDCYAFNWPPPFRRPMNGDDGEGCPSWAPRVTGGARKA